MLEGKTFPVSTSALADLDDPPAFDEQLEFENAEGQLTAMVHVQVSSRPRHRPKEPVVTRRVLPRIAVGVSI